jgi:photosystem II stability/assembly factor-like uncharacterized protein
MSSPINYPDDYLYALVASPDFSEDGVLFAARRTGLYRSCDRGQSWLPAFQSLGLETALPTTAVALSPNFSSDRTVFAAVEGNVLRSVDGGEAWTYTELGQPAPLVSVLCLPPDSSRRDLLIAGTLDDGILRSTNRGATWQRWNFGLLDPHIFALTFTGDGTIYAGTESGIFHSVNHGRAWREIDFPMDLAPVISLAAAGEVLFAGTEENGLYNSQDSGVSWQQLAPDRIHGTVHQVLVDGFDIIAVLDENIYHSKDLGKSWDARYTAESENTISSVVVPLGIRPEHPLWVGFSNGKIIKI